VAAIGRRSTSSKFLERHRAGRVDERVDDDDDIDDDGGQPTATYYRGRSELPVADQAAACGPVVVASVNAADFPSRKLLVQRACDVTCQTAYRVSNDSSLPVRSRLSYPTKSILPTCLRHWRKSTLSPI